MHIIKLGPHSDNQDLMRGEKLLEVPFPSYELPVVLPTPALQQL